MTADPRNLSIAIEVAKYLAQNGLQAAIVALLEPLKTSALQMDAEFGREFELLFSWGLIAVRRYVEAEDILTRQVASSPDDLDCAFLQIAIKNALREYEAVAELAAPYLQKTAGKRGTAPAGLFGASFYRARLLHWFGDALAQREDYDGALSAFLQAVDCFPTDQSVYIELAKTLVRLNRRDEAAEWIATGTAHCSDHQELNMLREYLLDRPRISACMIVKNEEQLLPGCLESIRDWVDEIVIVDTGSTDRTQAIAKEFGARLFEQPWTGDFSRHRNYSIEQASGDWIFIIDADERFVVDDVPLVIDAMREGNFATLSVGVFNVYGRDEERRTFCNSVRFFRRALDLCYVGIVHNALDLPKNIPICHTRARVKHLGYDLPPEQMAAKFQRTKELLQKQLADNPNDAFALFNYAELLRGAEPILSEENAAEIIRSAGKVIELIAPDDAARRHLRLMALNQAAVAHLARKDYRRAIEFCEKALALRPDYLDALFNAGLAQYGLRDFQGAIANFENYCRVQGEYDVVGEAMPIILSYPDATDFAHNSLGALYELTGRPDKAEDHYLKALEKNPQFRDTAGQLGRLYLTRGEFEAAERWYRHQLSFRPTRDALSGFAEVLFATGRFDQAESHYRQVIAQFGATWAAENDLGNSLYKQGRFGEAEQHYIRAAELGPGEHTTFLNLALAQIAQGRRQEAVAALEHYIEGCPGDPAGWQLIAEQLFASENWPEALACFENVLRLDPRNQTALLRLADCYLHMGQPDAASLGYQNLLRLDPNNVPALERLAALESVVGRSQGR